MRRRQKKYDNLPDLPTGLYWRHQRNCATNADSRKCDCIPWIEARVWDRNTKTPITESFRREDETDAVQWHARVSRAVSKGRSPRLESPRPRGSAHKTIEAAVKELVDGMRKGTVMSDRGEPYKPSTIRNYDKGVRLHVIPGIGDLMVDEVVKADLQGWIDEMIADGHSATAIRNALDPVRVVFRREYEVERIPVNPTDRLRVPVKSLGEPRYAGRGEAAELIAAAPQQDAVIWATLFYSGLRRGEIRALMPEYVDLDNNVIRVRWAWDNHAGLIKPKSAAAVRRVPVGRTLATVLYPHVVRARANNAQWLFPSDLDKAKPFFHETVQDRADAAWGAAGLQRITPQNCRHTYASLMIAAGVNIKAVGTYMGHDDLTQTLNRYSHLLPGNEAEAAEKLDAYLDAQ